MQPMYDAVKIVVLGKGVVGKSSLVYRFIGKENPEEHDATIEDRYKAIENIDGHNSQIEILDTAGEDDYQNLIDMWIQFADGCLFVFAINDKESFKALKAKYERMNKLKGEGFPALLVGNKSDLESNREVTQQEAKELAASWGVEYIETSALNNVNCKAAFINLGSLVLRQQQKAKGLAQAPHKRGGENTLPCFRKCTIF